MAENCFSSTTDLVMPLVMPEDVIFQILIWLPVQSLLRFKSMCKSWYALIKSSHFIQRHATITTVVEDKKSKLGGTFICQHEVISSTPDRFYLLSDEGCFKEFEDLGKRQCFNDGSGFGSMRMVDSVHGIICMYNPSTMDTVLWNPATRQCRLLPKSLNGIPGNEFVGLGFDVETKDYKVIKVIEDEGVLCLHRVQIYCLGTDSWRLIDTNFPTYHYCTQALGRSLNGTYFHICRDIYTAAPNWKSVILSFDLSKEKYHRALQVPDKNNLIQLESIGDKLACIMEWDGIYKVWMLNDFNTVNESWTALYRVGTINPKLGNIMAISWNGKFCLFKGKTLVVYNSIIDEFEDLGFGQEVDMYASFCDGDGTYQFKLSLTTNIYKESLVSVHANG